MKVEGSKWGMGCNSIHYMDLFSYLSGCNDFKFAEVHLEDKVPDAKREGFKEFMGRLKGENSRGDSLELICQDEENGPITIDIQNGLEKFTLVTNFVDHFNFKSSDETLPESKKLNTDIWYEENTYLWVKAAFDKTGYWEYRIKKVN